MKKSIIAKIQDRVPGYTTKADAEKAYDAVIGAVKDVVLEEKEARIPELGTLKIKYRPGRTGKNPQTGEAIEIAGRDVLTFKAAKNAI